ncbi:YrhB domain-containing protein [Variovorax sp. IB41]|uniref:YrhB domain-containing protein n=1 Tax=Variovorax sp. IB41 TaxID=2779370 RepID=UPI003FCDB701
MIESLTKEDLDGWYFPYQSKSFIESGDFNQSLVGNWPVFVDRSGGNVGPRRRKLPI